MIEKRKEEGRCTLNIDGLSAMGAAGAIPVSRSECGNEIAVLQRATARTKPAIGVIEGRWITKHNCRERKTENEENIPRPLKDWPPPGGDPPATT